MGESKWDAFCIAVDCTFYLFKVFQRTLVKCPDSPFCYRRRLCLDCTSDCNSIQRVAHVGPGFIKVMYFKRLQGIFVPDLQKRKLRLSG